MKQILYFGLAVTFATLVSGQENKAAADAGNVLYENNFEKSELDKVPSEFLVLDGGFAVKQEGANKFLELPGAPLETFGVLFGPTLESDVAVTAKMKGTGKGRRFPTFAVGLNGVGGYRLQVSPAKNALELYKGDAVVATAPYEQKIGTWMILRLENRKAGENDYKIEGKVWLENAPEPKEPIISFAEKSKPVSGRATIWGSPYAGTPIEFDDLKVTGSPSKK